MQTKDFDVAVIGGGVVGCAVLFELTRKGYKCLLLEKNHALLSEASSGNSGMLHTGFDAPPNSLELKCIKLCQDGIFPVLNKFNIPHVKCGTSLVAWKEEDVIRYVMPARRVFEPYPTHNIKFGSTGSGILLASTLPNDIIKLSFPRLQRQCEYAGIDDAVVLSHSELLAKEPFLSPKAHGALFVPGESVVDPNLLGLLYAHHARMQGAQVLTNCKVMGFKDGILETAKGSFSSSVTVNCGGLYGDFVDEMAGIKTFNIQPRKGHYCVLNKSSQKMANSIIFPIPTEKSKGVALFKTVYGNVVVGPTAQDVTERTQPSFSTEIHQELSQTATSIMPGLKAHGIVGHYTGVRPATQYKDYQIASFPSRRWMTVGGIRSTGVSASLGIAQLVSEKIQNDMDMEPSRGSTQDMEGIDWKLESNGAAIDMDGYRYTITHPICHFGHRGENSKL